MIWRLKTHENNKLSWESSTGPIIQLVLGGWDNRYGGWCPPKSTTTGTVCIIILKYKYITSLPDSAWWLSLFLKSTTCQSLVELLARLTVNNLPQSIRVSDNSISSNLLYCWLINSGTNQIAPKWMAKDSLACIHNYSSVCLWINRCWRAPQVENPWCKAREIEQRVLPFYVCKITILIFTS